MAGADRLLAILALAVLLVPNALAQTAPDTARRDSLAKVDEMLNDPDPVQRLVNMETIVREGDSLKVQRAIRIAVTSDDSALRGLAMKAFIARTGEITFALSGDPQDMRDLREANSERERREITRRHGGYLNALGRSRFSATFYFSDVNLAAGKGEVATQRNARNTVGFTIVGDRLRFSGRLGAVPSSCDVEIRPTKDLKLLGSAACRHSRWPNIGLSAPIE